MTLSDLHTAFDNVSKMPIFELCLNGEYELFTVYKTSRGLMVVNDIGKRIASTYYVEFNCHDKASDCLDMMLNDLFDKLLEKTMY